MSRTAATIILIAFTVAAAHAQHPHEKAYRIAPVTVTDNGEDRAYPIMRNAIARAPWHAARVSEYSAEVYLKGSFDVEKISAVVRGTVGKALKNIRQGENYTH
jgi:hypothetical protein